MTAIFDYANTTFRDFVADGVPSSGDNEPSKAEIRQIFGLVDTNLSSAIDGLLVGTAVVYGTRALLFADLAHAANVLGVVFNDTTAANNGIYIKNGSSGTGSWSLTSLALPSSFAADLTTVLAEISSIAGSQADALASKIAAAASAAAGAASAAAASGDAATALSAVEAAGAVKFYDTKAAAVADLANIANGQAVEVFADEDQSGDRTRYLKVSGSLVFKVDLDLAAARLGIYPSRADVTSAHILPNVTGINTRGFALPGDGGATLFVRASGATPGGVRSADRFLPDGSTDATNGGWWQIADTVRDVRQYGAKGDGITDDSAAFIAALSMPGRLRISMSLFGAYNLVGDLPIASGLSIELHGYPTLNIDASGNTHGLWFKAGCTGSQIVGDGKINLTVTANGTDGSYNTAIGAGEFYTTVDPTRGGDIVISGNITIDSVGAANGKPIQFMGLWDNVLVEGVTATGQANYCFTTHWCGNGSDGVLPTKTWHPDRFVWRDCKAVGRNGITLRGFTSTATGRCTWERCSAKDMVTQSFNPFCGDYGFTYCQNVDLLNRYKVTGIDCDSDGCPLVLSADGQSSGLNGSPPWGGAANGAKVTFERLRSRVPAAAGAGSFGATDLASLVLTGLDHKEIGTGNTSAWMTLNGIASVLLEGSIVTQVGATVRNCGPVKNALRAKNRLPAPGAAIGLSVAAQSADTTSTAAAALGDTQIALANIGVTTGAGAGCFLVFTISSVAYEVAVQSSAPPSVAATLQCDPLPVAVPSGTTITLVSSVTGLDLSDAVIDGYGGGVKTTGTATAKVRNVFMPRSCKIINWGNIACDMDSILGYDLEPTLDHGGLAASGVKYGLLMGATSDGGRIGPHGGRNNTHVRYLGLYVSGASNSVVSRGSCLSIDSTATTPAYMSIPASGPVNCTYGNDNVVLSGITAHTP